MKGSNINLHQACLLHTRADRVLRGVVSHQLENFEITLNEWLLLGVVAGGPKEGLTLSQVAEVLDVSQPQVTAIMTKVLKHRLVKQKVARRDRRSRFVMLTTRGKRLLEQIQQSIGESAGEWLGDLPPEQLEAYMKTVDHIANHKTGFAHNVRIEVRKGESHE